MATLVMSPMYEYGNFKSSSTSTHKGHSLQGRKSPVNHSTQNQRRNSTSTHLTRAVSPPHRQQQVHLPSPPSPKISSLVCNNNNNVESRKLERALSEPAERRAAQSNSSRYKTELCRPYEENGTCKYGDKCQFAHGVKELRNLARHPKYKTELCRTFHSTGLCPYGPRCHFIHNSDQTKTSLLSNLAGNRTPSLPTTRPKALSSSSLGSAGDISPTSSHGGSPTMMKSFDELFHQPSSNAFSIPQDFTSLMTNINLHSGYYDYDYNSQEFNSDFCDNSNIFQEGLMSSTYGCSSPGQLDSGSEYGCLNVVVGPTGDFISQTDPLTPTTPIDGIGNVIRLPVFNLFGKPDE